MFATDNPTRAVAHPPRLRGGLGRVVINVLHSFFKSVLASLFRYFLFLIFPHQCQMTMI
jgi:hypothetical protein